MRYTVRKENQAWIVRGSCGHFYAARKTHTDAIEWADTLATAPARRRTTAELYRARQAIKRMENK